MIYRIKITKSIAYLNDSNYIDKELLSFSNFITEISKKLEEPNIQNINELNKYIMLKNKTKEQQNKINEKNKTNTL